MAQAAERRVGGITGLLALGKVWNEVRRCLRRSPEELSTSYRSFSFHGAHSGLTLSLSLVVSRTTNGGSPRNLDDDRSGRETG